MASPHPSHHPEGFERPNYTPVPDELFDYWLTLLTGAELKVLLYITRRTFGFKRDSDNISLSQLLTGITTRDGHVLDRGVGLSKKTLLDALRRLEEEHRLIIREQRRSAEKGNEPTTYRLNIRTAPPVPIPPGSSEEKSTLPLVEKVHQGVGEEIPPSPRGKKYTTQKTVRQETGLTSKGPPKLPEEREPNLGGDLSKSHPPTKAVENFPATSFAPRPTTATGEERGRADGPASVAEGAGKAGRRAVPPPAAGPAGRGSNAPVRVDAVLAQQFQNPPAARPGAANLAEWEQRGVSAPLGPKGRQKRANNGPHVDAGMATPSRSAPPGERPPLPLPAEGRRYRTQSAEVGPSYRRHARKIEAPPYIEACMEQFSQELGDRAPLSSLTRMVRLWQQSGLTEPVFVQELIYPNRSKVRQTPNVKNRMAYFFSLIEDRLGLRSHLPPDG